MQTKYTPGPWEWGLDYYGLYSADGSDVLSYGNYEGMWLSYGQSREANARLIAAAPEMVESLRELRDYVSCIPESAAGGDDVAIALTRKADALLARINGGAE